MNRNTGFTLIELLVTVVLAIMLLSLSVGAFHAWTNSSALERAEAILSCDLRRARAHALARICTTRVLVRTSDTEQASFVSIERLDMENRTDWHPISISNRIEHVGTTERDIYFRTDGSCTDNEALIDSAAEFCEYEIAFAPYSNSDNARRILIDARTGMIASAASSDGESTDEGTGGITDGNGDE